MIDEVKGYHRVHYRKIHNYVRVSEVRIGTYILHVCIQCHTLNLLTVLAGNFCGVLIFIIFVVDLACSHKLFPPTKINAYGRVHDDGHGQKHRGSAVNTSQC